MGMCIAITGGTGSLGSALVRFLLEKDEVERIVVLSRDEWKLSQMAAVFQEFQDTRVRYFLGDVRDRDRLEHAFDGVDYVVHAAALKRVDDVVCNPIEVYTTNVKGTHNVLEASLAKRVKKVVFVSSDKAVSPANFYGATKMMGEHLSLSFNTYSQPHGMHVVVVRYGNVWRSRGSVLWEWDRLRAKGGACTLRVTDPNVTRFSLNLHEAVDLVYNVLLDTDGQPGDIYVPVLPSYCLANLCEVYRTRYQCEMHVTGMRAIGEKVHEVLVSEEESIRPLVEASFSSLLPVYRLQASLLPTTPPTLVGPASSDVARRIPDTILETMLIHDETHEPLPKWLH